MKKLLLFLVFIPCLLQAQSTTPVRNNFNTVKLNLLPDNMQQYIGKVTREQFEKVVGSMIDYNDATKTYSYAIINSNVSGDDTTIQCFYRESDNMLISVMFPTKYYLTYWIGFQHLKGFPKTQAEMERLGVRIIKEDRFGNTYQVDFKWGNFGMQIMNINDRDGTCTINYHIL